MRANLPPYRKLAKLTTLIVLTACLISACGGSSGIKQPDVDNSQVTTDITQPGAMLPESRYAENFASAEASLVEFDWMAASSALIALDGQELSDFEHQYVQYLQARIEYLRGNEETADTLAGELSLRVAQPALGNKVSNFQRHMVKMSGDNLASAQLGDAMLEQATIDQPGVEGLRFSIWRDLQQLSSDELKLALNNTQQSRWQGWLQLALLTAEARTTDQLEQGLIAWLEENPDHPGASALPGGLDHLLAQPSSGKKIALLLPLSGRLAPVAKAVRDGYLANYYASRGEASSSDEILLVDLNRYGSVVDAYEEVAAKGVNLVIGPLSKKDVALLGAHTNRPVPILALNQIDEPLPFAGTALVQLALAPEDEAEQIADIAFGRGARRAMVIRPQGSWGDKMERALLRQWQGLGGQLGSVASYSGQEDYSSSMAGALNLSLSEQRARDIRSMLATNIEFTARPRQDIDVIFLLSRSAEEARSLKPLLAYHYAGNLPVYATSSIYRGVSNPADKDLNGAQLVEIPWLLGSNPELHSALAELNGGNNNYARLNALGADAYLLQSRFIQLQAGPQIQIRGNTGLLSLDPGLRIERHLQPAEFGGGVLRAQ